MIRFVTLSIVAAMTLLIVLGGHAGTFGGVALFAVCVSAFGLLVGLCTEFMREI